MTIQEQLIEARAAYHDLMTGGAVVEVTDQNGERMKYKPADAAKLSVYITRLESQLNPSTSSTGPMRFWF